MAHMTTALLLVAFSCAMLAVHGQVHASSHETMYSAHEQLVQKTNEFVNDLNEVRTQAINPADMAAFNASVAACILPFLPIVQDSRCAYAAPLAVSLMTFTVVNQPRDTCQFPLLTSEADDLCEGRCYQRIAAGIETVFPCISNALNQYGGVPQEDPSRLIRPAANLFKLIARHTCVRTLTDNRNCLRRLIVAGQEASTLIGNFNPVNMSLCPIMHDIGCCAREWQLLEYYREVLAGGAANDVTKPNRCAGRPDTLSALGIQSVLTMCGVERMPLCVPRAIAASLARRILRLRITLNNLNVTRFQQIVQAGRAPGATLREKIRAYRVVAVVRWAIALRLNVALYLLNVVDVTYNNVAGTVDIGIVARGDNDTTTDGLEAPLTTELGNGGANQPNAFDVIQSEEPELIATGVSPSSISIVASSITSEFVVEDFNGASSTTVSSLTVLIAAFVALFMLQ